MSNQYHLAMRFDQIIKQMKRENIPPYQEQAINLTQGHCQMIFDALLVVDAINTAIKRDL